MRICILGRANYELLRRRTESYARRGHDVHVVTLHPAQLNGCRVHAYPSSRRTPLTYLKALPFVRRTLVEIKPDVVDFHGVSSYGVYTLVARGFPRVVTVYGPDIYLHAARNPLLGWIAKTALRRADIVYCSSRAVREYASRILGLDLGDRVRVFSWGIPVEEIVDQGRERGAAIRREFDVGPETRLLLHCRHLLPFWRVEEIVEAMPSVLTRHPDTQLWFVYPKPNPEGLRIRARLKSRVGDLGIERQVRFIEQQPYQRYISMLHAADLFLSVGENDLLASSLLEALCAGAVPILSDIPAYREVVEDGRNGFLVQEVNPQSLAATLNRVLADFFPIQRRVAAYNRDLVRSDYDLESCNDWLLTQYQELVRSRNSGKI